jgi:hypothetical protein
VLLSGKNDVERWTLATSAKQSGVWGFPRFANTGWRNEPESAQQIVLEIRPLLLMRIIKESAR